ncbi:MAG TPA: PQQ-binding-like beta-propeller repeat protein [Phycisphaerae bacterium]|nr:PQQ-binding-like beta-propeller repeat protein [Phycisphaerae bacterium]HRY70139.1 PQQ-binding-like beta-propeller repeat protein [Phycisphaerae bacterium]HSA28279.1 PQQ-binding-like beta-propeller repeat protein [Phycisphaerae bacterium]
MLRTFMVVAVVAFTVGVAPTQAATPSTSPSPGPVQVSAGGDWPMWGGRPDRNMVSEQRGLPTEWDVTSGKNIKWKAALGNRSFGNPVVSGGRIFIGTNNGVPRDPKVTGDKGVLMCFAEADGRFLWQAVYDKLTPTQKHDWPEIGLCSTPCVVGNRVYFVSNNCQLVCADVEGFANGINDGPFKEEELTGPQDADIVWRLDMGKELGVVPLYASASGPLVLGDLVYVVTGNGNSDDSTKVPAPKAPSFLAVDRHAGKVVWKDNSPGEKIIGGQWSCATSGTAGGRNQVVFPGGDAWVYAFEPVTGKLIWKFNCRPAAGKDGGEEENDPNTLISTPVWHDDKVFIGIGQSPELGGGPGAIWAIDAGKTGDVSQSAVVWQVDGDDIGRTGSTVAIRDGLLYVAECDGYLNCLDVTTGKRIWRHDLKATMWASPLVADGKVYITNEDGDTFVFRHGREDQLLATNKMKDTVYATAVAANGTLYLATRSNLYALAHRTTVTSPDSAPASPNPRPATTRPTEPAQAATQPQPATRPTGNVNDWPMFRGNPALTGVATSALPEKLEVRWKFSAPEAVECTAAISGQTACFGCGDGFLYALHLADGSIRWKYEAKAPIRSSPLVLGNAVYFGDDDGVFHAVDFHSGTRLWTFKTDGEIISSANFAGDRLLFGSYDAFLYCLSITDGKLLWKAETQDRVHGSPGVSGDRVLAACCDERLRVFSLGDGKEVASVGMGSYSGAAAALGGKCVYVGTFSNQVAAIDWTADKVVWRYEPKESQFPFFGSAAVTEDLVIIGGRDKALHAIDRSTGERRWIFATKDAIDGSPVVAGKRVFIGSGDGCLYGLALADGKELWRYEAGSPFIASPAVGNECLVIGTQDGLVLCFSAKS